jgi:proteasome lid subunit RPN8/RPN11
MDTNLINVAIQRAFLEKQLRTDTEGILEHMLGHDMQSARLRYEKACLLSSVHQDLCHILGDPAPEYIVSSLFLVQSHRVLASCPDENMLIATGKDFGPVKIIDTQVSVEVSEQSKVFVRADSDSLGKALCSLDDYGHKLLAWFHSHPGTGPASVNPSATDLDTQNRLERGGYPVVGGIFSRDGYIRFFSIKNRFSSIRIYGKLVEKKDETTFYIKKTY